MDGSLVRSFSEVGWMWTVKPERNGVQDELFRQLIWGHVGMPMMGVIQCKEQRDDTKREI